MRVAGAVLRSRYLFVRSHGMDAYRRFHDALSPDTQKIVEAGFLETRWYPYEILLEIMETADRVLGEGDLALCEAMGRFSADNNLTTLYRIFFKFGSVHFIIERGRKAWRAQYDFGELNVIESGPNSVTIRLEDVEQPHLGVCLAIKGWMIRAGELSGESLEDCEMLCKATGAEICQWHLTWL